MRNRYVVYFLLTITLLSSKVAAQNRGVLTTDPAFFAVSYVEVMPGSRAAGVAALKQYRDASRKDEGNVRLDVLQGSTRPNHFTIVETWQNQKAFDAHNAAAHTRQFRDTVNPVLGSPMDQRLFKVLE